MGRPLATRRTTTREQAALVILADQITKELASCIEAVDTITASSRRLKALIEAAAPWSFAEERG
jgi:hypothetical protein